MGEILCGGFSMPAMKYNDMWVDFVHSRHTADNEHSFRRMRRASHEALNKKRVTEFHPLHTKEAARLIDGILQNPNQWEVEFSRWV